MISDAIAGFLTLEAAPVRFCSRFYIATLRSKVRCLSCRGRVARGRLAAEPEGARVTVVEGDFFRDPLPDGHDVLIVANTVHVLSATHNLELLRNMRARAAPQTRLLLVDLWMDASRTQPPAAPIMSGEFLVIPGEGQAYGEDEAEDWLAQTGWRKLERRPLAGPASVIIAEAA